MQQVKEAYQNDLSVVVVTQTSANHTICPIHRLLNCFKEFQARFSKKLNDGNVLEWTTKASFTM
jgi:hypothetical protein